MPGIDLCRGVIMQAAGEILVYMYPDDPGRYLSVHGTELPEKVAALAGFDVAKFAAARKLKSDQAALAEAMAVATKAPRREVLEDIGAYKLVKIAEGAFNIETAEGELLNPSLPMEEGSARSFFEMLKAEAAEAEAAEAAEAEPEAMTLSLPPKKPKGEANLAPVARMQSAE